MRFERLREELRKIREPTHSPQHVALAVALDAKRKAIREIEALTDQNRHLSVQNDMQRRAIEKLKAQIERSQ